MAIPEAQLETWSHQGSVTQSSKTYGVIKHALERASYDDRPVDVFLQGSYGNDTNIYSESDVDVVSQLGSSVFYYDISRLPDDQKAAFYKAYDKGTYLHHEFKKDVIAALEAAFPGLVHVGNKAIKISAGSGRRAADVVAACQFRSYRTFSTSMKDDFVPGMCFFTSSGTRIANFPKFHSANCTAKHQETGSRFKRLVRVFKNMRRRLVDDGVIAGEVAPSYYIEGLLYNVPRENFVASYQDSVVQCFEWIVNSNRAQLVCANRQSPLLDGDPNVTWTSGACDQFLAAVRNLWQQWS